MSKATLKDPAEPPKHRPVLRSAPHGGGNTETQSFSYLRQILLHRAHLSPVSPRCTVQEDQIVWARSPVRLDLAGGWSDTPPYCLEFGGKVLNLAVDLNGQPPIQVFLKRSNKSHVILRSIDLGCEERITTFAQLKDRGQVGNPFGLAKAALALAGFLPEFNGSAECRVQNAELGRQLSTLNSQLLTFGSGLELSLLAAVPKGSGLGTSSILAATVLAALSDFCGLNWDANELFARTLVLEQMLTTGGGWQDQGGAIFRSVKIIETRPGLTQKPSLRWLPEQLFGPDYVNRSILLYYTGITRVAKNILGEIVRGLFQKSPPHLRTIADIAANSEVAAAAIQKCDYQALASAIRTSWTLNQQLDPGTNPPSVQAILDLVKSDLLAAKLLGAAAAVISSCSPKTTPPA